MREIKFRGWNGKNMEQPIYDLTKQYGGGYKLMQSTGLKDKHGTDVYEGDIIEFDDLDVNIPEGRNESCIWRGEIVYTAFGSRFSAKTFSPYFSGNKQFYDGKYTVIIGNKFENPELLEERLREQ